MENQIEILKAISQTHRLQFDQRRVYEWKTLIYTVSIFALSAGASLTGKVKLPESCEFKWAVRLVFFVFTIISSIYLGNIHKANRINKNFAETAEAELIALIDIDSLKNVIAESARTKTMASLVFVLADYHNFHLLPCSCLPNNFIVT